MPPDDYDKIMLSLAEKRLLHRILRKRQVPYDFCSDAQRELFPRYGLISIHQRQIITNTGRVAFDPGSPRHIAAEDKAFRYFLYRKEDYFKGKLPVVIALVALVISIISLALQYPF